MTSSRPTPVDTPATNGHCEPKPSVAIVPVPFYGDTLDALSRIELARRLEKVERKKAKDRQREHGGTAPGKGRTLVENSTQVSDAGKSRDSLAKKAESQLEHAQRRVLAG